MLAITIIVMMMMMVVMVKVVVSVMRDSFLVLVVEVLLCFCRIVGRQ